MLESKQSYFSFGDNNPHLASMSVVKVSYRDYKSKYPNHKQVLGSYSQKDRTIELYFSPEEFKANFGNRYIMDRFLFILKNDNELFAGAFNAKTFANAIKNVKKYCKLNGFEFVCKVDNDKNIQSYGAKTVVDCTL